MKKIRLSVDVSPETFSWVAKQSAQAGTRSGTSMGKGRWVAHLLNTLREKEEQESDRLLQALHSQMETCTICGEKEILENGLCQSCQKDVRRDALTKSKKKF